MATHSEKIIFRDRIDAGRQLAAHNELQKIKSLLPAEKRSYLVISLPRGGTGVGDEVAKILGITHDLVFPRKIPCPGQSEFAIGAVSELGDVFWNDYAKQHGLIDNPNVPQNKDKQIYCGKRQSIANLSEKTVILIDHGLAIGLLLNR